MPNPDVSPDFRQAPMGPALAGAASNVAAQVYSRVYRRVLLVAIPIMWAIAMATSMSFLRANTIEGLVTGLTASCVVALVALGLVAALALSHRAIRSLTGKGALPPRERDGYIVTASNCLLLVLWAAMMTLQHWIGANLFFWKLFGIDEPYPLINPDIDATWSMVFFTLLACTLLTSIARYLSPVHVIIWFALTTGTAVAWLVLAVLFTRSNDLINYRISIAALEGTVPWWMPGGEGGTILVTAAALVGFFRIRAAWMAVQQRA